MSDDKYIHESPFDGSEHDDPLFDFPVPDDELADWYDHAITEASALEEEQALLVDINDEWLKHDYITDIADAPDLNPASTPEFPDLPDDWEEIFAHDIHRHFKIGQSQLDFESKQAVYLQNFDYIHYLFTNPPNPLHKMYYYKYRNLLNNPTNLVNIASNAELGLTDDHTYFGTFAGSVLTILTRKTAPDSGNEEDDFVQEARGGMSKTHLVSKSALQNARRKIRSVNREQTKAASYGGKLQFQRAKQDAAKKLGIKLGDKKSIEQLRASSPQFNAMFRQKLMSKRIAKRNAIAKRILRPTNLMTLTPRNWLRRGVLGMVKALMKALGMALTNPYVMIALGIILAITSVILLIILIVFVAISFFAYIMGLMYLADDSDLNSTTIAYTQAEVAVISELMGFDADAYNEAASFISGAEQIRFTAPWIDGGINDPGYPGTIVDANPNATRLLLAPLITSIYHDPHMLLSGFTALYLEDINYPAIRAEINNLISLQYEIWYEEFAETRSRIISVTFGEYEDHGWEEDHGWYDDSDPENPVWVENWVWFEDWVWVEWVEDVLVVYEWTILHIHLELTSMESIFRDMFDTGIGSTIDVNDDDYFSQEEHFDALMEQGHGNRQLVGSPFDFVWRNNVSSLFGWRIHPISGNVEMHNGIDIALPTGTEVLAAHSGIITRSEYNAGGYGHWVEISEFIESDLWFTTDTIISTRYAHLSERLAVVGQEVTMGDVIGLVGSTGASTGPHLHFEVIVREQLWGIIDFSPTLMNPLIFAWIGDEVEEYGLD